jgi:hypothetical protein
MRRVRRALVAVALGVPCVAGAAAESWEFVVSVGGLIVADPLLVNGEWTLPIQADVSGLKTISATPKALNSALTCRKVAAEVMGRNIYITILTDVANAGAIARCPAASLGAPSPGPYSVYYRSPNGALTPLREIRIGL